MKKNGVFVKKVIAGGLAAMLLALTACGSADNKSDMAMNIMESPGAAPMQSVVNEVGEESYMAADMGDGKSFSTAQGTSIASNNAYLDSRKLIKTVNLDLETKEFDAMLSTVEERVASLGGYMESLQTRNGSRYTDYRSNRFASGTARIPKDRLDDFLNAVSEVGNVTNRSESVEDVTLAYVDMESRRNTLKTEQERLLALLETAGSLEDIIILEDRLSDVRYQLESMESQLRTYDNKVDFATVYLNISEVKELTPVEKLSTGERISNGFMNNLKKVGNGLVEFFIWFVCCLPYFAVIGIVIGLFVGFIKFLIWRGRRKSAARAQAQAMARAQAQMKQGQMQPQGQMPQGQMQPQTQMQPQAQVQKESEQK